MDLLKVMKIEAQSDFTIDGMPVDIYIPSQY